MSTRSLFPTRFVNTESSQVWPAHLPSPPESHVNAYWTEGIQSTQTRGEMDQVCKTTLNTAATCKIVSHPHAWYLMAPSQKETGIIWLNPPKMLWRQLPRQIFYTSEKNISFFKRKKKNPHLYNTLHFYSISHLRLSKHFGIHMLRNPLQKLQIFLTWL